MNFKLSEIDLILMTFFRFNPKGIKIILNYD